MAEILQFRNPKMKQLQKEFDEYLQRSESLQVEYRQVLAEIEKCMNEGTEPLPEIADRMLQLMGLQAREDRIGEEIVREMNNGHHLKDNIDEAAIIKQAWEDVYGLKVLE